MATQSPAVQSWRDRPTLSVAEAAKVLGLCRNAAYDAVNRGEIEVITFGKRKFVLTRPLARMLDGQAQS